MKITPLVLLICVVLVGCGGGGGDSKPPAAKATATKAADAGGEDAVTAMFDDYRKALGDRDWDRACSHLAPETTAKLQENITKLGASSPPSNCSDLMKMLYTAIDKDPTAKKTIDAITNTAKVDDVKINGQRATVNWSATVNGTKTPVTQSARIIDGEWKLIDVN